MKNFIFMLFAFFLPILSFSQQDSYSGPDANSKALNIFMDCGSCDLDYFRSEFTIVNYVNDYHDADVHIMVTTLPLGGGGTSYQMLFFGQGRYRFLNDTLVLNTPENFTYEESRSAMLDHVRLGLVPYLLKTPFKDKLLLLIDDAPIVQELKDPWRSWIFDISGSGSYFSEKFSTMYNLTGSVYLSKVTPDIKIESVNLFSLTESKLRYEEEGELIYSFDLSYKDLTSQTLIVKSLGDHFGIGGFATLGQSKYSNIDFQLSAGPALEYNIFNYDDASTRQCRILYGIMYEHSKYNRLTVNYRMYDDLFRQNLNINFSYFERWGSFSATAYGMAYLNNLSEYSLGANAMASLKVFKGFSVSLAAGAKYCRDQRSLRQEPVDALGFATGMIEMEQGLSYSLNLGISYRFGSKYNNSVNARFGF